MKILIVSGIFPPDIGGPANFVPRIAGWLTKRGHRVDVICLTDQTKIDDSYFPFYVHRISRFQNKIIRYTKVVAAIVRLLRNADLIFVNGLDFEARVANIILKKPSIHKIVGDRAWEIARVRKWYSGTIDEYQTKKWNYRFQILDWIRNFTIANAETVITPSHYLAKIVSNWGGGHQKINVIYNSTEIECSDFANKSAIESGKSKAFRKTIITVCRLVPWKGVEILINAIKEISGVRLIIVGDGPDGESLKTTVSELGLEKRVSFVGQVTKTRVRELLAESDIFVLNSSYEGLPHVVLEAMASMIPVIATDVGGTSEVVVNNITGLLIKYGDTVELTEALRDLVENNEKSARLARNGFQYVNEKFKEDVCFSSYEKLFLSQLTTR
jgi:glycosyltransferase involved in cell wall biosynthesis